MRQHAEERSVARARPRSTVGPFPGAVAGHAQQQPQDHVSPADIGRDHAEMLRRWIWRDFANILLGTWLIASPFTLGYRDTPMI
jgi:hypothetical protein